MGGLHAVLSENAHGRKRVICVGWPKDGAGRQGSAGLGAEKLENRRTINESTKIEKFCGIGHYGKTFGNSVSRN